MTAGRRLIASLAPLAPPALLILCGGAAAGGLRPGRRDAGPTVRASAAVGSVSLINSLGSGAILSSSGLAPGGSTSGQLVITSSGSSPAALTLANMALNDTAGQGGALLSHRLVLEVADLSTGATVYAGPLAGLGTRPLRRFEPGESRVYRFTATLPEGGLPPSAHNAYQGASASSSYVWSATALGGADPSGGSGSGASDSLLSVRVRLIRRQPALRKRRLMVIAGCNRPCTFTARAKMIGQGGRAASSERTRVRSAATNRGVTVSLRLSRKAGRRLRRVLRRRGGAQLTLAVSARDAGGRTTTFKRRMRVQRLRRGGRVSIGASWAKGKRGSRGR